MDLAMAGCFNGRFWGLCIRESTWQIVPCCCEIVKEEDAKGMVGSVQMRAVLEGDNEE